MAVALIPALTACHGQYEYRGKTCDTFTINWSERCKTKPMNRLTALSQQAATLGNYDRYVYDLELQTENPNQVDRLFIWDELANIYTYQNVDFQKALDLNQKAASLIKTIQETPSFEFLLPAPISPYIVYLTAYVMRVPALHFSLRSFRRG
jgi:hypothetical protein